MNEQPTYEELLKMLGNANYALLYCIPRLSEADPFTGKVMVTQRAADALLSRAHSPAAHKGEQT